MRCKAGVNGKVGQKKLMTTLLKSGATYFLNLWKKIAGDDFCDNYPILKGLFQSMKGIPNSKYLSNEFA